MKEDIFNQYVDRVISLYNITKEDLFEKTKKREIVDARQLIFFLCSKRPMQIIEIQKYMKSNGYTTGHSSVIYGINRIDSKVKEDRDYQSVIKEIERAVFI